MDKEELIKLRKKINLIENILRFQALGNCDTILTSIDREVEKLKQLTLIIPANQDGLEEFILNLSSAFDDDDCDDDIPDNQKVTKYQRWLADLGLCIIEIKRLARSIEDQIKTPVRTQVKSLAGIRNHTLRDY